jgi:large subunit ribosomal protein L15
MWACFCVRASVEPSVCVCVCACLFMHIASKTAIARIEALGGRVTTVYYNRLGLRVLLKPHKFDPARIPRFAQPTLARDRAYYSDPAHRGYLAPRAAAPAPTA